jgi:hypothetical protein
MLCPCRVRNFLSTFETAPLFCVCPELEECAVLNWGLEECNRITWWCFVEECKGTLFSVMPFMYLEIEPPEIAV